MTDEPSSTIADFGAQWLRYRGNTGYYASTGLLWDILGPLLEPAALKNARVAEIGAGTGRIVNMLLDAGVASVVAVEPSAAMTVLRQNVTDRAGRVVCQQVPGDRFDGRDLDVVLSIGVIHHIPDPLPVLRRAVAALRPGGAVVLWVYGHEGNERYLRLVTPLRRLTVRLPDAVLAGLCHLLNVGLGLYVALARVLPLPLRDYCRNVLAPLDRRSRFLVIFDQLNPTHAHYYREAELRALMEQAGLTGIRTYHRHGYSWTAIGTRRQESA